MRDAIARVHIATDPQLRFAYKKTARHNFRERFFDGMIHVAMGWINRCMATRLYCATIISSLPERPRNAQPYLHPKRLKTDHTNRGCAYLS